MIKLLSSSTNFSFCNYSLPKNQIYKGEHEIKAAIQERLTQSNLVLIIANKQIQGRSWIRFEIAQAKKMEIPILAVRPYQQKFLPQIAGDAADKVVTWNQRKIIAAILELKTKIPNYI